MGKNDHVTALVRLRRDYMRLKSDPVPYISAEPLPSNMLEWHYVVTGPEETPYAGGFYHGLLRFPAEYPFRPPSIYMITPSGRFKTNTRLCLSISDFHPDTWNPSWSVSTILTALLSFMLESSPTVGSIEKSDHERRLLARASWTFNLRDSTFCELFPDTTEKIRCAINAASSAVAAKSNSALSETNSSTGSRSFDSCVSNVLMLVAVAAFAVVLHHVVSAA